MRLRRPCVHDRYEEHWTGQPETLEGVDCPGGEFLADDALERIANALAERERGLVTATPGWYRDHAQAVLDALTVREGAG